MTGLPAGTVTFLFTDLEGSTRLWEEHPEAMRDAMARHDAVLHQAVEAHEGYVVKTTGDGVHAAFSTAGHAVDAAIAGQLALGAEDWGAPGPLRVRMGLHTGVAEVRDGDYYGGVLNRAARLMAIAHGGQIVASLATVELLRDDGYDLVDLGEHRLRDLGRAEHVFQVTHPALADEFPVLRSLESFPTNLPLQVTSFVGRSRELAGVVDALEANRVVTITGVGGVGKTRLALQTGAELLPRFHDGVWLCELGPLGNADLVPSVLAGALGVQQRAGQTMTESILATCARRHLLVVLDNCEHLLDAAARMVDVMVRSCPGVCVLATSREGLGVSGERIMVLRSLELPAEGASGTDATDMEAVRLFVDRAAATRSGFEVVPENVTPVVQICRRLDGIPLAIELAAARVRVMSPAEIASLLDERFRLLTGGLRTTVERHQTLRRAVDWSYDLLDDRERRLLNRLAVFAGGFTLGAATSVAGGGLDALDVLELLGQLVDKSLVVADDSDDGTRYRLLETIRQYALERLDEAGETDEVRRAHAQWMAAFVADAALGLRGFDNHRWARRFEDETDNLRAALTWAVDVGAVDVAAPMLAPIYWFFLFSSQLGYALAPWAATVLAMRGGEAHPARAELLALRALDHLHHDRMPDALADAEAAVAVLSAEGRFASTPWAALFMIHVADGSPAGVADRTEECLAAARACGDDFELGGSLIPAIAVLVGSSRVREARAHAEEAVRFAHTSGSPTLIGISTNLLAVLVVDEDPDRARALLRESLAASDSPWVGNMRGTAVLRLARLEDTLDDPEWAQAFRPYLARVREAGDRRAAMILLESYSRALAEAGHAEVAGLLRGALEGDMMVGSVSETERQRTDKWMTDALGEDRVTELHRRGALMSFDETLAVALAELDRVIASA